MLINAILILFTEVLLIIYGMATVRMLYLFLPKLFSAYEEIPFPLLAVLGLISSTVLAAVVSLFFPIQWVFQLILFLAMVVYTYFDRQWIFARVKKINKISLRLDFYLLVLFSLITALVLATSADVNRAYDDGLYHLQNVLMITKHAAIPGIGLLHNRFAYTSIWHATSALWGYQFIHPEKMVYFIATPLLMLNFLLYLFHNYRIEKNRYIQWASLLLLIVSIFYMVYYRFDFGSVGNDIPSYILTWISMLILIQIFSRFEAAEDKSSATILFIYLVVFAWTVKISTLMLILPAAYLFISLYKLDAKESLRAIGFSIFILFAWVAKSIITSGYFIYPPIAKWLGLSFKWQLPYAMALENRLVDMSWAKVPGAPSESVTIMSMQEWIPQWIQYLDKYQLLLIAGTVFVTLFTTLTILLKRKELLERKKTAFFAIYNLWMYASITFWFFSYPDPRFFYGSAMVIIASGMLSFSLWVPERYRVNYPMLTRSSVNITIIVLAVLFIRLNILSEIDYSNIKILPAEIPHVDIRHVELNGFLLNLPVSGNQCWGEDVPCIPDKCSESVYLMGNTVFDGLMFIEPTP
jgi:hypothetical protein